MRVGEEWQDKTDGSKIKIVAINDAFMFSYGNSEVSRYGTSGGNMFSQDFLNQYEKCSEVMVCK